MRGKIALKFQDKNLSELGKGIQVGLEVCAKTLPSNSTLQNYGLEELCSNLARSQFYVGLDIDRNSGHSTHVR